MGVSYDVNGEAHADAVTKDETDRKCPSCGGVMDFDPAKGKLVCPFCDYEEDIKITDQGFVAKELDFNTAEDTAPADWGTATKIVTCKSCGAKTVYEGKQLANECPYCGSNQVMETSDEHIMAPGGVVPFQLNLKQAAAKFQNWIGGKFFCPNEAKRKAKPESFTGMYVPFWTFDADTFTRYTGEYGKHRSVKSSDGKSTQTVTDWYKTAGSYQESFDDTLVCASQKMASGMIEGLEPYDTSKVVEYKPEYMAGFVAERYTVKMKTAWETAKAKMKSIIEGAIRDKIRTENHADESRINSTNVEYSHITYKYILLPVWISSFQYGGKTYRFMVNGQTGRVSGETPVSWIKVAIVTIITAVIFYVLMKLFSSDAEAAMMMAQQAAMFLA